MILQVLLFFFLALIFAMENEEYYYSETQTENVKEKTGTERRNGSSIQDMNENIVPIVRLFVFFSRFRLFQLMF
jgi:hypothetical protein